MRNILMALLFLLSTLPAGEYMALSPEAQTQYESEKLIVWQQGQDGTMKKGEKEINEGEFLRYINNPDMIKKYEDQQTLGWIGAGMMGVGLAALTAMLVSGQSPGETTESAILFIGGSVMFVGGEILFLVNIGKDTTSGEEKASMAQEYNKQLRLSISKKF